MNKKRLYIVYKHTSPSNKVYIGITCRDMMTRGGKEGIHYKKNKHFYSAIKKYGWNNFKHEILYSNLTREEASRKEQLLISKYKSNNPNYGYNETTGGESNYEFSIETKLKISQKAKEQWQNKKIRDAMIISLRRSHKGVYTSLQRESANKRKGIPLSEEHKQKLRGRIPWNKGKKDCYSKETREKMGISRVGKIPWNKGKKLSSEHKKKVSIATREAMSKPTIKQKIANSNKRRIGKVFKYYIYQYDLKDVLIAIHKGEANASRDTKISKFAIHNCVSGKTQTAGGYKWKRVSKEK